MAVCVAVIAKEVCIMWFIGDKWEHAMYEALTVLFSNTAILYM